MINKDVMLHMLGKGFYYLAQVDEYYIPDRKRYGKRHFTHDILIYGYDNKTYTATTIGYNCSGKYQRQQINIDLLAKSISNINDYNNSYYFKIAENAPRNFNIQIVIKYLNEFLESKSSISINLPNGIYGIDALNSFYKITYNQIFNKEKIDIRAFRQILDHDALMIERLQYMFKEQIIDNNFIEEYYNIYDTSKQLFILAIKYNAIKADIDGCKIKNKLRWIIDANVEFCKRIRVFLTK
jgi:hypothetical protein